MAGDLSYLLRRADEERGLAARAGTAGERAMHQALAEALERRITKRTADGPDRSL